MPVTPTSAAQRAASFPTPLADLKRASEIVRVLVEHGFGYLLNTRVLAVAPGVDPKNASEKVRDLPTAERFRRMLEALGPTYVKLGQILSTRADLVPDDYAQALRTLQDRAEPLAFDKIQKVVEEELGAPLEKLFLSFEREPLATASIAQVHRATIARAEGTIQVVVKVQRPGIRQTMRSDLSLLFWLARLLEGTIEEVSAYSPTVIVEEFEKAVEEELDFVHERQNLEKAGRNFANRKHLLVVPEAFPELSGPRVLTMTYLEGIKITDTRDDPRYDRLELRDKLVEATYLEVFDDGFFHGDPHPGNVLVLPDGRLGMIDYGLWGHLTKEQQDSLIQWLTAIALKSPSTLARLTLRIGRVEAGFDRAAYERDIARLMDKYIGVELNKLDSASIISDSVEVIRRHRIKLPTDFAVLARATATLEGVCRHLYPDLDFQAIVVPYVQRLMMKRLDVTRLGPEAVSLVLGLQEFVNEVPSQMNQLLLDLSAGRFRVGVTGEALEDLTSAGRVHGVRIVLALFACAFLVAAAITIAPFQYKVFEVPVAPVVMFLFFLSTVWWLAVTFLFPKGLRKIRLSKLMFWKR